MLDKRRESKASLIQTDGLHIKLTQKQMRLLDELFNCKEVMTVQERCDRARISVRGYYYMMKDPNFIKAMQLRNLNECVAVSPLIVKRVHKDALDGRFMQQRMSLEMSGDYRPQAPLVNILINQSPRPLGNADQSLMDKIIDILPNNPPPQGESVEAK